MMKSLNRFLVLALMAIPALAMADGPQGPGRPGFGPQGPGHPGPGGPGFQHPGFGPHGPRDPGWNIQQLQQQYDALEADYASIQSTLTQEDAAYATLQSQYNACETALPPAPAATQNVCTLSGTDPSGIALSGQGVSPIASDSSAAQAHASAVQNCLSISNNNASCYSAAVSCVTQ